MAKLRDLKSRKLESALEKSLAETPLPENAGNLFIPAALDEAEAERTGFSNYSYWRSTFRVFLKNRVAVFLLCVLLTLLFFTFIQPMLPGQYPALLIVNHPITKLQMSNVAPSFTTVKKTVPKGTELIVSPNDIEGWKAVTNVICTIKSREKITVTEYHGDWARVTYNDKEGYVVNDFTTKLKLPDDPMAVPYESMSNFLMNLYTCMDDYTNNGTELFVETDMLDISEDGKLALTKDTVKLRTLPSENAFWFGTNIIGQDLWAMVWSGTRTSLFIGFMVALVEAFIGILVGVLWGYVRRLDRVMTEVYNVMDNIPTTIVLILFSYIMRPGIFTLVFAMCLTEWVGMARFIRNQIVIIRDRDYNLASRCLGTGTLRI
ncbi:MAG: ABC transporter permease, partial [Alphaproteobacteria bacterium]|nr:ABC transporter permease [Alphaproteobacteria bacterium]